jgi:hypothetical protein
MTVEDAKDEVLRMIGPEAKLVAALKKRGFDILDWNDDGKLKIQFAIGSVIFDINYVAMHLTRCGYNLRLHLQNWKCDWNGTSHDCEAVYCLKL